MTDPRERIIQKLLGGDLEDFIIVGLESSLELVLNSTKELLDKPNLKQYQFDNLIEHYHDGRAMIRVLHYYTGDSYNEQKILLNRAWGRMMGEFY